MATVTFYQAALMLNPTIWYGTVTSASASAISLSDGAGNSGTYYGAFTYSASGWPSGTLTGYDNYANWSLEYTARNASLDGATVLSYLNSGNASGLDQYALSGNDTFTGSAFADDLRGYGGNDLINGGNGLDTAAYSGNRANFSITQSGASFIVADSTGTEGTDTVTNVERLQFADTKLALDLDGNAGMVAKVLGAVFGSSSLSNKAYVGIGLGYLDGGMSYPDLMALAINAAGATTNGAVVDLLWTNLFGVAPTAAEAAPYVAMLDSGSYAAGTLGVLAADTNFNTDNINLVGLAQTGIEFA